MCTGRVDLAFLLRAFRQGADGVIIGGCWPGECHYVTEGNYDALGNTYVCRYLLEQVGVSSERIRIEWIAASEGSRFAEVMSDFAAKLAELGPIGEGEGIQADALQMRLEAVSRLVPFLKLVEREKLRVPAKSEEAYRAHYESAAVKRVFQGLVADKLAVSQIVMLLESKPHSTAEISERLGLTPSHVSRYMQSSSREGLVRYDLDSKRYTLV